MIARRVKLLCGILLLIGLNGWALQWTPYDDFSDPALSPLKWRPAMSPGGITANVADDALVLAGGAAEAKLQLGIRERRVMGLRADLILASESPVGSAVGLRAQVDRVTDCQIILINTGDRSPVLRVEAITRRTGEVTSTLDLPRDTSFDLATDLALLVYENRVEYLLGGESTASYWPPNGQFRPFSLSICGLAGTADGGLDASADNVEIYYTPTTPRIGPVRLLGINEDQATFSADIIGQISHYFAVDGDLPDPIQEEDWQVIAETTATPRTDLEFTVDLEANDTGRHTIMLVVRNEFKMESRPRRIPLIIRPPVIRRATVTDQDGLDVELTVQVTADAEQVAVIEGEWDPEEANWQNIEWVLPAAIAVGTFTVDHELTPTSGIHRLYVATSYNGPSGRVISRPRPVGIRLDEPRIMRARLLEQNGLEATLEVTATGDATEVAVMAGEWNTGDANWEAILQVGAITRQTFLVDAELPTEVGAQALYVAVRNTTLGEGKELVSQPRRVPVRINGPTILRITPAQVSSGEGIIIMGRDLKGGDIQADRAPQAMVEIGGLRAFIQSGSETELFCWVPPLPPGTHDVVVTNSFGIASQPRPLTIGSPWAGTWVGTWTRDAHEFDPDDLYYVSYIAVEISDLGSNQFKAVFPGWATVDGEVNGRILTGTGTTNDIDIIETADMAFSHNASSSAMTGTLTVSWDDPLAGYHEEINHFNLRRAHPRDMVLQGVYLYHSVLPDYSQSSAIMPPEDWVDEPFFFVNYTQRGTRVIGNALVFNERFTGQIAGDLFVTEFEDDEDWLVIGGEIDGIDERGIATRIEGIFYWEEFSYEGPDQMVGDDDDDDHFQQDEGWYWLAGERCDGDSGVANGTTEWTLEFESVLIPDHTSVEPVQVTVRDNLITITVNPGTADATVMRGVIYRTHDDISYFMARYGNRFVDEEVTVWGTTDLETFLEGQYEMDSSEPGPEANDDGYFRIFNP